MKVTLYTSNFCGYCNAAKSLLKARGLEFEEIDLSGDHAGREQLAARCGGRTSVPQIFINELPIGGFTELRDLDKSGKLSELLESPAD
jgi:glutaredoxin 3